MVLRTVLNVLTSFATLVGKTKDAELQYELKKNLDFFFIIVKFICGLYDVCRVLQTALLPSRGCGSDTTSSGGQNF